MRLGLVILLFINSILLSAQNDVNLSLQIIDANVCFNKKTSGLNFSYYFENHSDKHLVVVDYYEPCIWETLKHFPDTNRTLGLVLRIRDDSGHILLPTIVLDTAAILQHEKYTTDSAAFFEKYDLARDKDYVFHTRSLRPQDVLMNLYNLRLNKRKCFYKSTFNFDYSRKYSISLHYSAKEDVGSLINRSALGREDELFVGELNSNEVSLCFK